MRLWFRVGCLAALAWGGLGPNSARAQVWAEAGDAGNSATAAQLITGASLNRVNGSFNTSSDMDAYRFTISTPAAFSATTQGGNTPATADTMLFLFNAAGVGIAMNDDLITNTVNSTLPAGNALYANLPAGQYVLAVSQWRNVPTNGTTLLFDDDGPGVFGPRSQLPFTGSGTSAEAVGSYSILLTGVAPVPEPGTLALCSLGVAGYGFVRRRKVNV